MEANDDNLRKIIHVDMDAFYAAVEQRDHPELKGKPVIVGGDPRGRGVVSTCSYEARKFGVRSAMSASMALRLCPQAIFVRPRFDVYQSVSQDIRSIFREYTDLVEPLSLDEAYLDVTANKKNMPYATDIAREILTRIREKTGLTASAGVSFNKFLAKVASDINKPNGLTVITPKMADKFIDRLPIRKFYGVGKVTEKKMLDMGIKTGADLKKIPCDELINRFGKTGRYYFDIARGHDLRQVNPEHTRKSIGQEHTFPEDISNRDEMIAFLEQLAGMVADIIRKYNVKGRTLTLKVRYFDFISVTRSVTPGQLFVAADEMMAFLPGLLDKTDAGRKKVRLLGVAVSHFV